MLVILRRAVIDLHHPDSGRILGKGKRLYAPQRCQLLSAVQALPPAGRIDLIKLSGV